jgi:anti-anti-sigma regulatory factor
VRKAWNVRTQVKRDLQREVFMTGTMCFEDVMRKVEATRPCELTELVRGCDRHLVEEMTPIVRRQSVSLDITSVERIDAAGIAALISIYRVAKEAGNSFSVSNAAPHVAELLALVGLDGILLSHNAKQSSHSNCRLARSAA